MGDIISEILYLLEYSPRMGSEEDNPEGTRYIQISDTLAKRLTTDLRDYKVQSGEAA